MYSSNLGEKNVTDNRRFWKTVKPLLSDKLAHKETIKLSKYGEIVKTDMETAKVLDTFFSNVVQNLNISKFSDSDLLIRNIKDPTLEAVLKYRKYPSIIPIESKYRYVPSFSFVEVNVADIEKEVLNLNGNDASQNSDMRTKVIKENSDTFSSFLCNTFNSLIKTSKFPQSLKLADITPLYKKGKNDQKENYRPISILPNLSNIFERCILKKMSHFFEDTLSNQQCGFRKGLSTEQCLLVLLGKWKSSVDRCFWCLTNRLIKGI